MEKSQFNKATVLVPHNYILFIQSFHTRNDIWLTSWTHPQIKRFLKSGGQNAMWATPLHIYSLQYFENNPFLIHRFSGKFCFEIQ